MFISRVVSNKMMREVALLNAFPIGLSLPIPNAGTGSYSSCAP